MHYNRIVKSINQQTNKLRSFVKKADKFIIIAIIAVAGLIVIQMSISNSGKADVYAEIYHDSDLLMTIDLSNVGAGNFHLEYNPNITFEIFPNGGIAFTSSDCPDKICVNTGKLTKPEQTAACLPNRIILTLRKVK